MMSCGGAPGSRRRDRARRFLDGLGHELRAGPRVPAGRFQPGSSRSRGSCPPSRAGSAELEAARGAARVHRPRPPRPGHRCRVCAARPRSPAGGRLAVSYHESDVGHSIDPAHVPLAARAGSRASSRPTRPQPRRPSDDGTRRVERADRRRHACRRARTAASGRERPSAHESRGPRRRTGRRRRSRARCPTRAPRRAGEAVHPRGDVDRHAADVLADQLALAGMHRRCAPRPPARGPRR